MSEPSAAEVTILGFRVKIALIALCCLVAQTTAAVVLTRYSKMQTESSPIEKGGAKTEKYSNSSLVVSTEFVKFVASLSLVFVFDTVEKLRAEAKVVRESKAARDQGRVGGGGGVVKSSSVMNGGSVKIVNKNAKSSGTATIAIPTSVEGGGGAPNEHKMTDSASAFINGTDGTTAGEETVGESNADKSPSPNGNGNASASISALDPHDAVQDDRKDESGEVGGGGGGVDASEPAPLLSLEGFKARYGVWKTILYRENLKDITGTLKLSVPALLYTIQNNVIYTALNNLEATTFQVGYQSKVVTTAVLSVLMLNRSLSPLKWTSLLILTVGIILTQLQPATDGKRPSAVPAVASAIASSAKNAVAATVASVIKGGDGDVLVAFATTTADAVIPSTTTTAVPTVYDFEKETHNNQFAGMVAVMVASFCSAFAGVYFEKILKGTAPSVWVRNAQLAWFSMIIGMIGYLFSLDPDEPFRAADFFKGYSPLVYVLIAVQALGGLIIACVVKYADNILKGFATAVSIVLCGVLSAAFMGFFPSFMFVVGSGTVILATMLYSKPDKK